MERRKGVEPGSLLTRLSSDKKENFEGPNLGRVLNHLSRKVDHHGFQKPARITSRSYRRAGSDGDLQ